MLKPIPIPLSTALPMVEYFNLGPPSCVCQYCDAIMWREESTWVTRRASLPTFQLCCNKGNVKMAPVREPPQYLKDLLQSIGQHTHHFHKYIRAYNGVFCFTSMGGKVDHRLNDGRGAYIYSIGGQIFHRIGSLIPPEGQPPVFLQIYIFMIMRMRLCIG